nr:large ribosomal subunit protein uL16m-like [Nerophis lumbriciformis]
MISLIKTAVGSVAAVCSRGHQQGLLHGHLKALTSGVKTYEIPPDFSDVLMPERTKLKFMDKVPNLKKPKKEMKKLRDIQGPAMTSNTFTNGQYAIVAMGGGYLHFGHIEMMRLIVNRKMDTRTTFARWRIKAPYKPITRKGLGQRMGGGKGAIDHYVTPVRCGRFIIEVGGKVELKEVEDYLIEITKKLPFPSKVMSRESLEAFKQKQIDKEKNNQNPWTFKKIVQGNMLGIRKVLSPRDLANQGRYTGKFFSPGRV